VQNLVPIWSILLINKPQNNVALVFWPALHQFAYTTKSRNISLITQQNVTANTVTNKTRY